MEGAFCLRENKGPLEKQREAFGGGRRSLIRQFKRRNLQKMIDDRVWADGRKCTKTMESIRRSQERHVTANGSVIIGRGGLLKIKGQHWI